MLRHPKRPNHSVGETLHEHNITSVIDQYITETLDSKKDNKMYLVLILHTHSELSSSNIHQYEYREIL